MTPDQDPPAGEEPRIILEGKKADEGWKEKARREKEKLAGSAEAEQEARQLPPASFLGLVEDLAMRAMLALGQFRDPATGEVYIDLEGAKYVIDLLGVLEAKTKGNLEPGEAAAVKEVLQNLRLAFVQVSRHLASAMAAQAAAPQSGKAGGPSAATGQKPEGPGSLKPEGPAPQKPGPKIIY